MPPFATSQDVSVDRAKGGNEAYICTTDDLITHLQDFVSHVSGQGKNKKFADIKSSYHYHEIKHK